MIVGSSLSAMEEREREISLPVGAALKMLRELRGLTASQVGKLRGVGEQAVYGVESDRKNPRIGTIEAYLAAMEVTETQFVGALRDALEDRRRRQERMMKLAESAEGLEPGA